MENSIAARRVFHNSTPVPLHFRGFHDEEWADDEPFRWMSTAGVLAFAPADIDRFLECAVLSEFHDLSQALTITVAGRQTAVPLAPGWMRISEPIPAGAAEVRLSINKAFPAGRHAGDPRELGMRVRAALLHGDPVRHSMVGEAQRNAVANVQEMLDGRSALRSTPPSLGIDLYGACNVKPPCVYCEWDWNKALEGEAVDTPFTTGTLDEWGAFFRNSTSLVNCSIGEPFMMKNIDELLDAFAAGDKRLEMTTNGQILTERNIQKLLGRSIDLYISLDAATAETYAKLRNTRFDPILVNVRRLVEAKGGPGRLPRVNLVFMPMKVNVHELDRFVEICAELRVDRLVLRPLNYSPQNRMNWDRAGYRFDYQKELLPFDTLVRTSGRAAELCRRAGVPLSDQMDFGGAMGAQFETLFEEGRRGVGEDKPEVRSQKPEAGSQKPPEPLPSLGAERTPACTEPWKSLYILRRGVFPCCYGSAPLAPMTEYRTVWNSPVMQAIRADLARGRFHRYCLTSPSCPIVRKGVKARDLPAAERLFVHAYEARMAVDRQWRRAIWLWQWSAIRAKRLVTEPSYWKKHLARPARALGFRRGEPR